MSLITFYPLNNSVAQWTIQPTPASKSLPEWYKKEDPNNTEFQSTIKRCMSIFDVMTAGYTLYFPCDIYVDATDPDVLDIRAPYLVDQQGVDIFKSNITNTHPYEQYLNYTLDSSYHRSIFRVDPLWYVSTEEGYSSLFIPTSHPDNDNFAALPGIIDTDKYVSQGYFSIAIKKGFKGIIKQGTPLVQVFPFKREEFSMVIGTQEDYEVKLASQIKHFIPKFYGAYKSKLRSIKKYV
jgi:hypothetical protein